MTPENKTKLKNDAEIRSMDIVRTLTENESDYIVEGYAAKYDPYVLYKDADGEVYEQFSRENFELADKSDIILQYDHAGRVYARTSNGSLKIDVDDIGLKVTADLGRTEAARQLYEDIQAGMITKMSWRFSVLPEDYKFDKQTRTLTYNKLGRIYDVSAVSLPANDSTEIGVHARSFVDGLIAEEKARIDAEERKSVLKESIKTKLGGIL